MGNAESSDRSGLGEFCYVQGMLETGGQEPVSDGIAAGVCLMTGHSSDYSAGVSMGRGLGVSAGDTADNSYPNNDSTYHESSASHMSPFIPTTAVPIESSVFIDLIKKYKENRRTDGVVFENPNLPVPTKTQYESLPVANSMYRILHMGDSKHGLTLSENGKYIPAHTFLISMYKIDGRNLYNYYFVQTCESGDCWVSIIKHKVAIP